MEQEYKWKLTDPAQARQLLDYVQPWIIQRQDLEMSALYYDTPDGLLWQLHGGLRLRRENGVSVCCLKLPVKKDGSCTIREEYEVEADTLEAGLDLLPRQGAPAQLCARLRQGLTQLCAITYTRQAWQLSIPREGIQCQGELTVDLGSALRQGQTVPISEMEFEYKAGDEALFHTCARQLEAAFGLEPELRSKLALAMGL